MSSDVTIPEARESAKTIHSETTSVNTIVARVSETTAAVPCVHVRIRRLSNRSARTPPQGPSSRTGPNASAALIPRAVPLPVVSVRMSHDVAVNVIHVPIAEMNWPMRKSRKLREPRADANVRPHARVIRGLIGHPRRAAPAARPRIPGRHAPRRRAS